MPAGVLPSAPPPTPARASLASRGRRWGVLVLAAAQVLAVVVAAATTTAGAGGAGVGLLVATAPWTFGTWGVVVAGCLLHAVHQLPAHRGDEPALRRVAWPLMGAMAGVTAWLVVATTGPAWAAAAVFALVLALLVVSYDTALRHRRLMGVPTRLLLLGTLGVGTGWAAVTAPVHLASALAALGLPTAGAGAAAWQAGALLLALGAGAAVVARWRARAASTLAAAWGLLAVASGAGAREGGAVLAALAAVGAVALLGWAVWSRWSDLRRRVEASTVRLGRGPVV